MLNQLIIAFKNADLVQPLKKMLQSFEDLLVQLNVFSNSKVNESIYKVNNLYFNFFVYNSCCLHLK